jgi:dihydroorotase-like cyclic amidohydrolase
MGDMLELVNTIFNMTSRLVLTGEPELMEKEVDAYHNLMEEREPLIAALMKLSKKPDENEAKIINEIIELDKKHQQIINKMMDSVKSSIKEIKSGKRLNNVYGHLHDNESIGLLDAKQ